MPKQPQSYSSTALWHARLFGAFRLESATQTVQKFESNRTAALLVYLILHPDEAHTRESLSDRIWPDADLTNGQNRLKQALASLRRLVEPPGVVPGSVLEATRGTIMLRKGAIDSDFAAFVEAEKAGDKDALARLATGEFLPGLYDEWLDDLRLWVDGVRSEAEGGIPREVFRVAGQTAHEPSPRQIQLPVAITPCFGREDEMSALLGLIEEFRLVTVTGVGGTGKTRLTLQVARAASQTRVCMVPLAEVEQPEGILPALIESLGLILGPRQAPLDLLRQSLASSTTLLVLDNMEQLVGEGTALIVRQLLAELPELTLLVSSRVPLGVESEVDFPLYPLPIPSPLQDLQSVAALPAAQLLVERARRSRADFQITERNHEAVRSLLVHLGGMPLAIELCAAWAHVLSPAQMLAQLRQGADLLVSNRKDIPARQRSLVDAFASTLSLLPQDQRDLLIRLSVFRGGVRLEWLEEVLDAPGLMGPILDLARAALIQPVSDGDRFRYSLLESLRQFATELPDPSGLRLDTHDRLIRRFLGYAVKSASREPIAMLGVEHEGDWWRFWREEWDNLRVAIQFGLAAGRAGECVSMLEAVEWFVQVDSREPEVVGWLEACLESDGHSAESRHRAEILLAYARRKATSVAAVREQLESLLPRSRGIGGGLLAEHLWRIANLTVILGEFQHCEGMLLEALALSHDVGTESRIHMLLSHVYADRGETERAEAALDECARAARAARLQNELFYVAHDRAKRYLQQGLHGGALEVLAEVLEEPALVYNRRLVARCFNLRGEALYAQNQANQAFITYADAVMAHAEIQDSTGIMYPLWNLGTYLIANNRHRFGVLFFGAAYGFYQRSFAETFEENDQAEFDQSIASAREALGAEVAAALLRRGRAMGLAQCRAAAQDLKAALLAEGHPTP
jgi:predicted ATPase